MGLRLFILPLLLIHGTLLAAEPEWKQTLSAPTLGNHPPLPAGKLNFQVSWKGIVESGRLSMEFSPAGTRKPNAMVVQSSAVSLGLASTIFPYQGHGWSELDPKTLRPLYFRSTETDRQEEITTSARYHSDRIDCVENTRKLADNSVKSQQVTFAQTPAFDIMSALLFVRSQKLAQDDEIRILLHPFNNPYLLKTKVLGREKHLDQDSIRLSVSMQKIDRKTLELKNYKKLKKDATMWLSDDADRVPIELRADLFIGDVRAILTGFEKS